MKLREYHDEFGELKEEIILSKLEQRSWYDQCIKMIMRNTGWVLENIEDLTEFRVNWEFYGNKAKRDLYRKEYYKRTGK